MIRTASAARMPSRIRKIVPYIILGHIKIETPELSLEYPGSIWCFLRNRPKITATIGEDWLRGTRQRQPAAPCSPFA